MTVIITLSVGDLNDLIPLTLISFPQTTKLSYHSSLIHVINDYVCMIYVLTE